MTNRLTVGLAVLISASTLALPAFAADLVLYDKLDFAADVAKAFTAKTGLTIDVVEPGSTGELLGKIAAEGDNPQFDVVWVDGSAVIDRMFSDGILQKVPDDVAAKVKYTALGSSLMPKSGAFVITGASTTAIEVDIKKVAVADAPKSWADLEKFAGFIAAKDPNFSGPAYQWLAGFFQTNGVETGKALLEKALSNKEISGLSSGGKVNKAILTGDAKLGINQDSSVLAKIAAGEPVVAVYPSEGSVALPEALGISAKTKHMDAVKAFVTFVTSPEGQAAAQDGDDTDYFFMPVIEGVKAKAERPAIKFIALDDATASAHEEEWKTWYKENFVR